MLIKNLKQWHKIVCSEENYICRVCKKDFSFDHYFNEEGVNQYVCGHHYPHTQKARPDLVLETSNGVCICLDCHTKAHKGLVQIPEKEEVEEGDVSLKKKMDPKPFINHILPSGHGIRLKGYEKLCKCGYVAQDSGICIACEKRLPPSFKS